VLLSVAVRWGPFRTAVTGTLVARLFRRPAPGGAVGSQRDRWVRPVLGNHCFVGKPIEGGGSALSAYLDVPVDVAFVRRGRDQGATGWADIAGPKGRAKEWSPSAYAAVGLGEPEPSERTTQWRCHAQDCNGAALARIVPPMREWLMGLGRLEPPTSSLSGFCPAACSPQEETCYLGDRRTA
jgi:hypothetical protein